MKKLIPIYLYGAVIILEGIFLFFSQNNDFNFIRITTGITLTIGAILAYYCHCARSPATGGTGRRPGPEAAQ